jgi:hypothetical protein
LGKPISRRSAIKAGGIAALGLAFSKPIIQTVYPQPAFAQLSAVALRPAVAGMTLPLLRYWASAGATS